MKKRRAQKKLVIVRETLANLEDEQLLDLHGGSLWTDCSFACPTSQGAGLCAYACDSIDGCGTVRVC